jgi:hypothetical protein
LESIRKTVQRLNGTISVQGANSDWLAKHVGLNVDIAHMRIARIKAADLRPFVDRIVHAHISDHPGMHTHDQIVGSWTNPGLRKGGYSEYLDLLLNRAHSASGQEDSGNSVPFSGAVAVELEGSDRMFWIHDSLARLKHAIQLAAARHENHNGSLPRMPLDTPDLTVPSKTKATPGQPESPGEGLPMNVRLADPAVIAIRTLAEEDQRAVRQWLDRLKNWRHDNALAERCRPLEVGLDMYALRTDSDMRIVFHLEGDVIEVVDFVRRTISRN